MVAFANQAASLIIKGTKILLRLGTSMRTDTGDEDPIRLSLLSCAYNEEANISGFLSACLGSKGPNFTLEEVLVVASGCTDRTEAIVRSFQQKDPRVRLVSKPERTGKVPALLEGLQEVHGEVVLIENADTVPSHDAFDRISATFRDPEVELVGAHPIPVADTPGLLYRLSKLFWDLHDSISVNSLKIGEAYALRMTSGIQLESCEDDDSFFSVISHSGRIKSRYARDAMIWTRPPATFDDLWNHRYRIARLIARRREVEGEGPSTWDPRLLVSALGTQIRKDPRETPLIVFGILLELSARIAGRIVVSLSRAPFYVWKPILTTKRPIAAEPGK
jgi:poly-beta-1,6-N-acetyl-D-glucosamine synthase